LEVNSAEEVSEGEEGVALEELEEIEDGLTQKELWRIYPFAQAWHDVGDVQDSQ